MVLKQQKTARRRRIFNGFDALKRQIPFKKIVPNRLKTLKSFRLRRANDIFFCLQDGGGNEIPQVKNMWSS